MIYPIIILVVIVVVVVLMMMVLIPSMAQIYGDFGAELPLITRMLMSMSAFFISYWWAILVVLAVLIIGGKYYLGSPKGKRNWDKLVF